MSKNDKSKLAALLKYFTDNNIKLSNYIQIKQESSKKYNELGFSITCKNSFKQDDVICRIPKASILSTRNSAISSELPEPNSVLEHHLLLALTLIYERTAGVSSPWHEYIQALPQKQHCGIHQDVDKCKGTSLFYTLAKYQNDIKQAWILLEPHTTLIGLKVSLEEIMDALSLVTSRTFNVDDFHKDAFVPLADLFNHKSNGENVHFVSDNDVCVYCGFKYCDCEKDEQLPLDHPNASQDSESDEEMDNNDNDDDEDMMEMIACKDCRKGNEVYSTFGELSNTELFTKYGFIEEQNQNDDAIVHEEELKLSLGLEVFEKSVVLYKKWEMDIIDIANIDDDEEEQENNSDHEEMEASDDSKDIDMDGSKMMEEEHSQSNQDEGDLLFQIKKGESIPLKMFIYASLMDDIVYNQSMEHLDAYFAFASTKNELAADVVQRIINERKKYPVVEGPIKFIQDYEMRELNLFAMSLATE